MQAHTDMFDISNPQQRERLLVVFAGVALLALLFGVVPGQFTYIRAEKNKRDEWRKKIDEHERTAQDKDEIQRRLTAMQTQALAAAGTPMSAAAVSGYQAWLMNLATSAGLGNTSSTTPSVQGQTKGALYVRHIFSITAEGRLEQIAEFLRRFHRTEYLHIIQSVQPFRQLPNRAGMYSVTFKIEVVSLPKISLVSLPSSDRNATRITDEERLKMTAITNRAILSEYRPPAPVVEQTPRVSDGQPPPPVFDDVRFCFLSAVLEADGVRQCWIIHRTLSEVPRPFREGDTFILAGARCIIKKIIVDSQQIHVDVGGTGALFSLQVGKHFDEVEEVQIPEVIVPVSEEPVVVSDSEEEIANCFMIAAAEENGTPLCRIRNQITRTTYILAEGGVFMLAGVQCSVKSIDGTAQRVIVNIGNGLYAIRVGRHFDQVEEVKPDPVVVVPELNERVVVSDSENDIAHCFLTTVIEEKDTPQCWILNQTTNTTYILSEGGVFTLAGVPCGIKSIDITARRVTVDIGGGLFFIRVGRHFDQVEEMEPEPGMQEPDAVKEVEATESSEETAENTGAAV